MDEPFLRLRSSRIRRRLDVGPASTDAGPTSSQRLTFPSRIVYESSVYGRVMFCTHARWRLALCGAVSRSKMCSLIWEWSECICWWYQVLALWYIYERHYKIRGNSGNAEWLWHMIWALALSWSVGVGSTEDRHKTRHSLLRSSGLCRPNIMNRRGTDK